MAVINVIHLIIQGKSIFIQSFKEVEHPFVLSNYLNAFQLSFPVLAVGVSRIFGHILKINNKGKKGLKKDKETDMGQTIAQLQSI